MSDAMKQQTQGGFLLAKIHQLGGRIFGRLLRQSGVDQLNPAQGRIMFVLWQEDDIPIKELVKRTQLDKSTLTSMLDRLEQAGLVRRVPSTQDRRTILLQRTQKDKDLEALYVRVSNEMAKIWYKGFKDSQIRRFEADLQQILDNLTDFEKEP
jgi:MarR family transcriptional regulator, organic hydroperoxide resistance regulator